MKDSARILIVDDEHNTREAMARYLRLRFNVATAADGEKRSLERTIEGFRGFLYCLEGAQEKGIVYGSGAWKKGDIKESPALNEAYEMGRHA